MKRSLLFFVLLTIIQGDSLLLAQKWSASIDKNKIRVGEPIIFTLTLEKIASLPLLFPNIPDSLGNGFEVISEEKMDSIWSKDRNTLILKKSWRISAYDSGMFFIPSIPLLSFKDKSIPDTLLTDSFPVLVQTLAVDTTKAFKDVRGLYDVSLGWRDYIWFIIIGISLLLIAAGLWLYIRYRKKHKNNVVDIKPIILLSPFDEAMETFTFIEKNACWEKGKVKQWYTDVTDVLRQYLSRQYGIQAFEMTSAELDYALSGIIDGYEIPLLIRPLLKESDLVKFAKYKPSELQCSAALNNCRKLVTMIENQIQNKNNVKEEKP